MADGGHTDAVRSQQADELHPLDVGAAEDAAVRSGIGMDKPLLAPPLQTVEADAAKTGYVTGGIGRHDASNSRAARAARNFSTSRSISACVIFGEGASFVRSGRPVLVSNSVR